MKLLASVVALASADYACCPYDEYGIPFEGCILTEKTPWAFDSVPAHDALGVEQNQCKSWEANIGAMNDGQMNPAAPDDWGTCGFQRHFPWQNGAPLQVATAADVVDHTKCALGFFDCVGTLDQKYKVLSIGSSAHLSLEVGVFSGASPGTNTVTGDVHLGGVCKLFVPVAKAQIKHVSVAGVHVLNIKDGVNFATELDAHVSDGDNFHHGTVYCFSVINLGEFVINSNDVANGNVAGDSDQSNDVLTTDYAQNVNFGTIWPGAVTPGAGTQTNGKVNVGSNFDVVVHFESVWCASHWTKVDMQKAEDHGAGTDQTVGSLASFRDNGAAHDTYDKRFHANSCGCCNDVVAGRLNPIAGGCRGCGVNPVDSSTGTAGTMDASTTFTYAGPFDGTVCIDVNTYQPSGSNYMWPNAGAWAGFYSFVTCSNNAYLVYGDKFAGTVAVSGPTETLATVTAQERVLMMGGLHTDYRHGRTTLGGHNVRGNLRQVGSHVQYCADGDELLPKGANPVGDTSAWSHDLPAANLRCTWNWNYLPTGFDDEMWFDSDMPMHMDSWNSATGAQINHGDATELIDNPAAVAGNVHNGFATLVKAGSIVVTKTFAINLLYDDSSVGTPPASTIAFDASKYWTGTAVTPAAGKLTGAGTLNCLDSDNSGAPWGAGTMGQRDNFPDCYFGDEIHFEFQYAAYAANYEEFSIWKSFATMT